MKHEIEVTTPLRLNESQIVALDTHSFLNILNVLCGELYTFGELSGEEARFDEVINQLIEMAKGLSDPDLAYARIWKVEGDIEEVEQLMKHVLSERTEINEMEAAKESVSNVESICVILRARVTEVIDRADAPLAWKRYAIDELTKNYIDVLGAIEKNSKGRFRIVYNIAAQQKCDYYVDFKIESTEAPYIEMPPVLIDVVRDLIANARKYTEPGGRINAGILCSCEELVIRVEDSGCGIPVDELERVVEFGARGSNTEGVRTMGDGLGLTKAYHMTKLLNGRMWLASEEGVGTRVKISIPRVT